MKGITSISLFAVLLAFPAPRVLADRTSTAKTVEFWRGRMAEIERRAASFSVAGTELRRSIFPDRPEHNSERVADLRLDCSGPKARLELFMRSRGGWLPDAANSIIVDDGLSCFNVHSEPSGGFVFDGTEPRGMTMSKQLHYSAPSTIFRHPFHFATTLSAGELLGSPSFTPKRVESRTLGGVEVDVIEFELAPGPDNNLLGLVGELRFSRRHGGELQGYRVELMKPVAGTSMRFEGEFTYRAGTDGELIPQRLQLASQDLSGESTMTWTFDVREFQRTEFRPDHFSLAAFGLNNLASPPVASRGWATFLVIGIGLALVVLVLVFRRQARRAQPA